MVSCHHIIRFAMVSFATFAMVAPIVLSATLMTSTTTAIPTNWGLACRLITAFASLTPPPTPLRTLDLSPPCPYGAFLRLYDHDAVS